MKAGIVTIVCAAALLAASGARAQSANADSAQAHFDRGAKLYNLGHFQDAIGDFEKAYDLDPSPIFLFNIAQSHRQLGNKERALFFYRRYLEQAPKAANREDVERRIKELQASLQQEAEAKQKPPTDVAPHVDTREHDAPKEEAVPAEPTPGPDVAPPPVAADDRRAWQVAVGLAPAFPTVSGSPAKVPTMFAARLEGGYGIALPAGELAVGVDIGYARLPYTVPTTAQAGVAGTSGDSAFWGVLAFVRYLFGVTSSLKLGAGVEGGYVFWSGLGQGNPFTKGGVAPTGAIGMPSVAGQLRGELLLVGGLFVALTPELLWSKITSSSGNALAGVISSVSRFDVTVSVGYAF